MINKYSEEHKRTARIIGVLYRLKLVNMKVGLIMLDKSKDMYDK